MNQNYAKLCKFFSVKNGKICFGSKSPCPFNEAATLDLHKAQMGKSSCPFDDVATLDLHKAQMGKSSCPFDHVATLDLRKSSNG